MTAADSQQHLADLLAAQFHLLWPLDPTERMRRIDAIRADYEQEEILRAVDREMSL